MPDVFSYTSYARFMRDFYAEKKKANPKYSYGMLSQRVGLKSRSNLIEIANGKVPLSRLRVFQVARAMDLGGKECEYFVSLVHFNNANSLKEKEFHLAKMGELAGISAGRILGEAQYAYFSEWYHPAIRELACMPAFQGDFAALGRSLRPPISAKEARESVDLLIRLGLLRKTAQSRFAQADGAVQTADELTSYLILRYQKEGIRLAESALESVVPEDRDFSTLTAGVSRDCFLAIKKEIQAFRRHLSKLIDKDKEPDRVYQVNLQLFPLSAIGESA
jgi:uncharacterized protein (TIGR02147 family)